MEVKGMWGYKSKFGTFSRIIIICTENIALYVLNAQEKAKCFRKLLKLKSVVLYFPHKASPIETLYRAHFETLGQELIQYLAFLSI